MATRENQGLQAIIIVLTILVLLLGVGLILVNNARKTQKATAESNATRATDAGTRAAAAEADSSAFKEIMGFDPTDNLQSVREAVDADMATMAANFPPESRQYSTVLRAMHQENRQLALNAANSAAEVKTLKDRLLALEGQKAAQVKKFEDELAKVRADAATAAEQAAAERTRILAENDGVKKQMEELRASHEDEMAKLEEQKTQLTEQITNLEDSVVTLREGVPNPDQFAQPADGEVVFVNQRYSTLWVNLGSADGLRPQVTFAVAEAGLEDAASSEQKGSIEITKIEGPHRAEATITSDSATNPIMPGDRIFSQVWDRGRKVGIAIAGKIDIEGDGQDDLEKLKSIVTASGGTVDAAPNAAGEKEGTLKVSTRYLVQGEYPTGARDTALLKSWTDLEREADALGVEKVSLDEFLSLMGWRSDSRSTPMDAQARAIDFPPQPREQEMPRRPVQPSGGFKKRLPNTTF
jgi:type II secretory pathway pseudopilin PulG